MSLPEIDLTVVASGKVSAVTVVVGVVDVDAADKPVIERDKPPAVDSIN